MQHTITLYACVKPAGESMENFESELLLFLGGNVVINASSTRITSLPAWHFLPFSRPLLAFCWINVFPVRTRLMACSKEWILNLFSERKNLCKSSSEDLFEHCCSVKSHHLLLWRRYFSSRRPPAVMPDHKFFFRSQI